MTKPQIGDIDWLKDGEEPDEFKDQSFEMTGDYVPTIERDLITLNGHRVLTTGNIMLIIAPHGTGKTSIVQAIIGNGLNSAVDAFGFKMDIKNDESILLADTERSKNDLHRGFRSIINMANLYKFPDKFNGKIIRQLKMVSYKFLDSPRDFIEHLSYHCSLGYRMIILDVITDFVSSINKEEEANKFVIELMKLADKYNLGMIVTIHPNPKDKEYKARGVIGTTLMNKAESVFACFRVDDKVKTITTDFPMGKVRNGMDKLTTAFIWDDDKKRHVSVYLSEDIKKKINKEYLEYDAVVEQIYEKGDEGYSKDELLNKFREKVNQMELDFGAVESYIQDRKTLEVNSMDNKYYRKEFTDDQAPF